MVINANEYHIIAIIMKFSRMELPNIHNNLSIQMYVFLSNSIIHTIR